MYRLFKGELKKIFSGFEIFIMLIALIVVFTILPHFFKPKEQFDYTKSLPIDKTSVISMHTSLDNLELAGESDLNKLSDDLDYMIGLSEKPTAMLRNKQSKLNSDEIAFDQKVKAGDDQSACFSYKTKMFDDLRDIEDTYSNLFTDHFVPMILVTKDLDYKIRMGIINFKNTLNSGGATLTPEYYSTLNDALKEQKFTENLAIYFNRIKDLPYDKAHLQDIQESYLTGFKNEYKTSMRTKAYDLYTLASSDDKENVSTENRDNMLLYVSHILQTNEHIRNVVRSACNLEFSSPFTDDAFSQFIKFPSFNSFKEKETETRNIYLLNHNLLDTDVSSVFAFNMNSSTKSNAFDYMFFTLEIVGVIIIVFTAIIGAEMITKEQSTGTIKLLLMKPYSRNKIMFSKILATLFVGNLLILIGVIVSLITGTALYGISIDPMLMILNAQVATVMPNLVVFIFYLLCLMLKVWFYALLSIMISTLFKSLVASICISGGICVANIIVTFLFGNSAFLKYDLFANLDLFKYFGGGFITENMTVGRNIENLFAYHLFQDTNILVPALILLVSLVIFNIVTFITFKKRDIS